MRAIIRGAAFALAFMLVFAICASAEDAFLPSFTQSLPNLDEIQGLTEGTLSSGTETASPVVGEIVCFGMYEQDASTPGEKTPIEWVVLDKVEGKLLLLAKSGLETGAYNSKKKRATWAECSLRTWLNDTFFQEAFSPVERTCILSTTVVTPSGCFVSPATGETIEIAASGDTQDRVFLLNVNEVETYFPEESQRMVPNHSYLFNKPMESLPYPAENTGDDYAYGNWWLRDVRADKGVSCVFHVKSYGRLASAAQINLKRYVIRPAMWVDEVFFE